MIFGKKRQKKADLPQRADEPDEINMTDDELEDAAPINPYYARVASLYSTVRYLLLVFLVLLISFTAIRNSESITYDNLMFLFKDLGSVAEASGGKFETISYNPDTTLSLSGFRKNLAVAASSGLKIYASDGKMTFEGEDKFSTPLIESSDRYLLVYDFGGSSFSLYNSFARIYTDKFDYDITGADISNSGTFALVTKTKEYNSAVLLYSKSCKLKNRYLSEDRVIDVAINDSGSRVCILSFAVEKASFVTKIMITKPGESKALTTLQLEDVFPLSCEYTSDGNLTVFCDKALYFYDDDGSFLGSFELTGEPESARLTEYGTVITQPKNAAATGSYITVLGSKGNILYSGETSGKTTAVDFYDGYLFVLTGNILTRTDIKSGESRTEEVSGNGKTMIVYSKDDVMICSGSVARYYDFAN